MNDLISRQAAVEAIVNTVSRIGLHDNSEVARYGATFRQHEIIDIVENLPSAESDLDEQAEREKINEAHNEGYDVGYWAGRRDYEKKWIPVSKRLPEKDKEVLITYQYKEGEGDRSHSYIDITTYGDAYFGGRKCSFKEWRAPFEYFHSNYEVVAWMPLPDPWKGE